MEYNTEQFTPTKVENDMVCVVGLCVVMYGVYV